MMNLTENQKNYLEIITSQISKIAKQNNLSKEYIKDNFNEIFIAAHNSYQNFLKNLINDEDYKNKLFNITWNELRGV